MGWRGPQVLCPSRTLKLELAFACPARLGLSAILVMVLAEELLPPPADRVEDSAAEGLQGRSLDENENDEILIRIQPDYNSPVMSFLRFLMLLSLVAWIGGLMFFAFVLAPTVFAPGVLPNTHLAGNVVGRALGRLHWIAIVSAVIFLASSQLYSRLTEGTPHVFAMRHVLIGL